MTDNYMAIDETDATNTMLHVQIFAAALGHMLQDTEGVCVAVADHKFFVYVDGGMVNIDVADDSDIEPGTMVWMHRDTIQ